MPAPPPESDPAIVRARGMCMAHEIRDDAGDAPRALPDGRPGLHSGRHATPPVRAPSSVGRERSRAFPGQRAPSPGRARRPRRGPGVTNAALEAAANGIAHALIDRRGLGEEPVAVLLGKSPRLIAAFLGVLAAGKAFRPWIRRSRRRGSRASAPARGPRCSSPRPTRSWRAPWGCPGPPCSTWTRRRPLRPRTPRGSPSPRTPWR